MSTPSQPTVAETKAVFDYLDFQPIDPIADRLVVYRSREVINRIEPLSSTSSLRMTLAMYFNGIEKDGW